MIYLHLGVHKTATTYLQELLLTNWGKMAANGRAFWPLTHIRPVLAQLQDPRIWVKDARPNLAKPSGPLHRLHDLIKAAPDCTISDENLIGYPRETIEGQLYPHAESRLRMTGAALSGEKVEIWLCLRSYDDFLASIYVEALRHGYFAPIDAFTQSYDPLPDRRWPALVDAVRSCFPASRLVIWTYEEFDVLRETVATGLSGLPFGELCHHSSDTNPSPSGKAIDAHAAKAAAMTRAERILSMAMCEDASPRNAFPAKFYPWRPDVAEAMKAAYRADLDALRERGDVEFLSAG